MKWFPGCRKTVNTLILDALNIIVKPTDIDNIIERVRSAIKRWSLCMYLGIKVGSNLG